MIKKDKLSGYSHCTNCGTFEPPPGHECQPLQVFINKINLEPVGQVHAWDEARWAKETRFLHINELDRLRRFASCHYMHLDQRCTKCGFPGHLTFDAEER